MVRTFSLGDLLTNAQVFAVIDIIEEEPAEQFDFGRAVKRVEREIIEPALPEINRRLGQENDARYLAYAVVYAIQSKLRSDARGAN